MWYRINPHPEDKTRQFPVLVVVALIHFNGMILLERRAPTGVSGLDFMWNLPGGKVECLEDPAAAIVREIKEELGIAVRPARLLPTLKRSTWKYGDVVRHWILSAYECTVESGQLPSRADLQWFQLEQLPNMLEADAEIIQEWATLKSSDHELAVARIAGPPASCSAG